MQQSLDNRLIVLHTDDDIAFTDYSPQAFDFLRDDFTVSKTIYIGFRKPINAIYFRVKTSAETPAPFTYSYWNGSWTELEHLDSTQYLTRSGFLQWHRDLEGETKTVVNGISAYWYKIEQASANEIDLYGIGALLCSDQALEVEYPSITHPSFYKLYPAGTDSHIYSLVSARDTICSQLNISAWDLLNLPEISTAASFLTLSKIFNAVSDRPEDRYAVLAQSYSDQYRNLKSRLMLTIDKNDNGKEDPGEKQSQDVVRFSR